MTRYPAAHDEAKLEPVPATSIATWPIGSFVENIALRETGEFVISIHNKCELHLVSPGGGQRLWTTLPASPAGLVALGGNVFAATCEPGAGPHRIFKINDDGTFTEWLTVPDTLFLNGFTPGRLGHGYAVDSIAGMVLEIDLEQPASRVLLQHELLTKCSDEPMLPGANGIKIGDGGIYITNTDRALLLHAPFGGDGLTGQVDIVAERLRGDDLALDTGGNIYITTHIHNTLIQLRPNGERIAIAGPEQGMAGCTACAFDPATPGALFVTTTGGVVMPLDGVMREAKLVRLDTGATGRPIAFA